MEPLWSSSALTLRHNRLFSSLIADRYCFVRGAIAINDIDLSPNLCSALSRLLRIKLSFVTPEELSLGLVMAISDRPDILALLNEAGHILLPGEGSKRIWHSLQHDAFRSIIPCSASVPIPVIRVVDPSGRPTAKLNHAMAIAQQERVAVLMDDVISTGVTASVIRHIPSEVPPPCWLALTWVLNNPKVKPSGVAGYDFTAAALVVIGEHGRVPINSLSTLFGLTNKAIVVRRYYGQRYAIDQSSLEAFVSDVRSTFLIERPEAP